MDVLILGGTGFLSREIALEALARGHSVTCLTRGITGEPPPEAEHVVADREEGDAYLEVSKRYWDEVVDITRTPSYARGALEALGDDTGHWTYVSSISVYRDLSQPGANEDDPLWDPLPIDANEDDPERYGESKSACEAAAREAVGDRLLVARAGLIVGEGDVTDRFGYWPGRFARGGRVLVPGAPDAPTSLIDARDLAEWVVDAAGRGDVGTYDTAGPVRPLAEVLAACAEVAGFEGETIQADLQWLLDHGVSPWAGPESLPLWLPADFLGLGGRTGDAARAAGLICRPLADTIEACLADERQRGLDRERVAGLTPDFEAQLIAELLG